LSFAWPFFSLATRSGSRRLPARAVTVARRGAILKRGARNAIERLPALKRIPPRSTTAADFPTAMPVTGRVSRAPRLDAGLIARTFTERLASALAALPLPPTSRVTDPEPATEAPATGGVAIATGLAATAVRVPIRAIGKTCLGAHDRSAAESMRGRLAEVRAP
jgi:hypothetical protein